MVENVVDHTRVKAMEYNKTLVNNMETVLVYFDINTTVVITKEQWGDGGELEKKVMTKGAKENIIYTFSEA